jgi:hypothetical protein
MSKSDHIEQQPNEPIRIGDVSGGSHIKPPLKPPETGHSKPDKDKSK